MSKQKKEKILANNRSLKYLMTLTRANETVTNTNRYL